MRYKHTWFKYPSKLATFISFLQGGFAGWAVLAVIFMIPGFICLIAGADEIAIYICLGVGVGLSFVIWFICAFIDADKVDDFMCRKSKTRPNTNEEFFVNLYDTAISYSPRNNNTWNTEFILYSIIKTKIDYNNYLTQKKTNINARTKLLSDFDKNSLTYLKKKFPLIDQEKLNLHYQTRIVAYQTLCAIHKDNNLLDDYLNKCFQWFLCNNTSCIPYGTDKAIPYDEYLIPKNIGKYQLSEQEKTKISELELKIKELSAKAFTIKK